MKGSLQLHIHIRIRDHGQKTRETHCFLTSLPTEIKYWHTFSQKWKWALSLQSTEHDDTIYLLEDTQPVSTKHIHPVFDLIHRKCWREVHLTIPWHTDVCWWESGKVTCTPLICNYVCVPFKPGHRLKGHLQCCNVCRFAVNQGTSITGVKLFKGTAHLKIKNTCFPSYLLRYLFT